MRSVKYCHKGLAGASLTRETSLDLTSIHQPPDETLQDFVARLWQVSVRIMSDTEVSKLIVHQLIFEHANKWCKEATPA